MEMFSQCSVQKIGVKIVAVLPFPHVVNTLTRSPYPDFDINIEDGVLALAASSRLPCQSSHSWQTNKTKHSLSHTDGSNMNFSPIVVLGDGEGESHVTLNSDT